MFGLAALLGLFGSIFDVTVDRYWEDDENDHDKNDAHFGKHGHHGQPDSF